MFEQHADSQSLQPKGAIYIVPASLAEKGREEAELQSFFFV